MTNPSVAGPSRRFNIQAAFAEGTPYPHYAWFREHDPIHIGDPGWPLGHPTVYLFQHAEVMRLLKDPRMVRRASQLPEMQAIREEHQVEAPEPGTWEFAAERFMLFQDPPDHTRLRGLANRAFTPRVVADRRAEIEQIAAGLVAAFQSEGGEGDLIQALAYPLPVLVIARVLGVPHEDMYRFREWAAVLGAAIDLPMDGLAAFQARANDTTMEISEYLRGIVALRRAEPRDDLVSRLIAAQDDEGRLDEDELIAMVILLILAGHETTVNLIANGTLALLRHRDQWDRLVADPTLAGNATEELLRYDSPVQLTTRMTGEEVEIGDTKVPRGTEVFCMLGSANRDAAVWDEPNALRIDREVKRHMAFGMGIHFCLGAPLARLEGEIAFATLAREAPELALMHVNPRWRPGAVLHGLERLDVRLAP